MSSHLARTHNHLSNRAKARSVVERRPLFKSVLQNPFQIAWPSVPPNVQNTLLARLVAALEDVPPRVHTSRKSLQKTGITGVSGHHDDAHMPEEVPHGKSLGDRGASPHLIIGINTVTKALESQLSASRKRTVVNPSLAHTQQPPSGSTPSSIAVVFVCCADVDPSALVDHIPYLVAGCNSPGMVAQPIKLVPLPKDSEPTISQILGVRRAAVVAFRHESPLLEAVQDGLGSVPILSASWLQSSSGAQGPEFVPTHIKQLRTTAPKDMKSAREQRSKARAAAKKNSSSPIRRKARVTVTTG